MGADRPTEQMTSADQVVAKLSHDDVAEGDGVMTVLMQHRLQSCTRPLARSRRMCTRAGWKLRSSVNCEKASTTLVAESLGHFSG